MPLWRLHSQNVHVNYKGTVCSKASCFVLLCTLFAIIAPFVVLFNSNDFWRKTDTYSEQPKIYFKGKLIVVLEGKNNQWRNYPNTDEGQNSVDEFVFITWSTFPVYNHLTQDKIRNILVKMTEDDYDADGIHESNRITIQMDLFEWEEIYSVKLLLFFDYTLKSICKVNMETLAYVHYNSFIPGNYFHVFGDLNLVQNIPFIAGQKNTKYNGTIIREDSINLEEYKIDNIFKSYVNREVLTNFEHVYPMWSAGRGTTFTINVDVRYPRETITYIPSILYQLKWVWIQYFSFVIVALGIFNIIKSFVFQNRIFPVVIETPWKNHVT